MPSVTSSPKLAGAVQRHLAAWYESTADPYGTRFEIAAVDLLRYDNQSLEVWVQLTAVTAKASAQHWRVGLPYSPGDDEWVRNPLDPQQTEEAAFMIADGLQEWWNTRQGARAWRTER